MSSAADPTATFYQNLQSCGLLTATQLRELWGWIAHKKPDLQTMLEAHLQPQPADPKKAIV